MRDIRDRENRQPARPKSAPLSAFQRPSGNSSVQRVTVSSIDNGFRGSMTRDDRANIQESARRKISAGDTVSIILHRGERGFGFSIRGGEGMPLFVLRIAEGGPAYEDGRVNVRTYFIIFRLPFANTFKFIIIDSLIILLHIHILMSSGGR